MKQIQRLLILLLFAIITQSVFSQEKSELINCKNKIDSYLKTVSYDGEVETYRKIGSRKIIIKGSFQNGGMKFRQKIKIYKSGLKKETVKIYKSFGHKFLIADIVLINEKPFFAKYYETKLNGKNEYFREYEIEVFDQKNYRRIYYEEL
jgi:hypothetical protein